MSDTNTQPQAVKFNNLFTPDIEKYIEIYKKQGKTPSVAGFGNRIGASAETLWAWANKKKKDEQGNILEELARPNFHQALTKLAALENEPKVEKLTPKQELFCQLYAASNEHFGNATQSYAIAYGIDSEDKSNNNSIRASASALLTNLNILKRVDELLGAINDDIVDQELAYVIKQRFELPSKVAAIREWNKVKGRITEKIDHTTKGKELPQVVGFNYLPPKELNVTDNANNQTNA